jgi:hypothetical protein
VDVEQIMRDIRSNIAQRHGVELTDQQVQELAARRLESILDPRTIKPSLLDQLRRAAGARPDTEAASARTEPPYTFEDTTLFESPNAFVRFMRRLLAPILKLFFNPNPLIRALNIQARLNKESIARETERDQRQAEWNALHYELLQRVVSETAKVSLEVQSLALRVESLAGKVDFNERRVRGIDGAMHAARPAGQRDRDRDRDRDREREAPPPQEVPRPQQPSAVPTAPEVIAPPQAESGTREGALAEAPKRRRRRRRGRRGGGAAEAIGQGAPDAVVAPGAIQADEGDEDLESDASIETEAEAVDESSTFEPDSSSAGNVGVAPEAGTQNMLEPAGPLPDAAPSTTDRETREEPGPVPAQTEVASTPEPVREPEAPPVQSEPRVLEPEEAPEEPTPERDRNGQ